MANHITGFIDGDPKESDFITTDELLEIEWVKSYKEMYDNFYKWGICYDKLMATYNNGKKWVVVGMISRPELVQIPSIVSYESDTGESIAIFEDDTIDSIEEEKFAEEVWFLFGIRIWDYFLGFTVYQNRGEVAQVTFDWKKAFSFLPFLKDANKFLLGFYHTHPGGDPCPSSTDTETMGTWVFAMGRPMLCGIKSGNDQKCYLYKRASEDSSDKTEYRCNIKYKSIKSTWVDNLFFGKYHEGK